MTKQKTFFKLLQVSFTTNIFEWYEFVLFSYFSVIIGHLFFSAGSNFIALILGLFIFASSYIIRPLGSLFFGYIGDKYNVSISLKYSTIIMAIPTFFIGILPTYDQIGVIAPIILIILRLIQGFTSGGELPICSSYIFQKTYDYHNRTLLCGLVNIGGMVGVLLSSFVSFLVFDLFSSSEIQHLAWRIPFLISLPLSWFIFKNRSNILQDKAIDKEYNFALNKTEINFSYKIIKALAIMSFLQVSFYILFVWMPLYLTYFLNVSHHIAKMTNSITLATLTLFTVIFAYLGKYIDQHKFIIASLIATVLLRAPSS